MPNAELLTAADVLLMQDLAQRITASRLDLVNAEATYGELAWNWGKDHPAHGTTWPRRLWLSQGELAAWAWARLPHQVRRNDGTTKDVTSASLAYQVHPDHPGLLDEVIDWYDETAAGLERTVTPTATDRSALERWTAHGYVTDPSSLGDTGFWTQLNERDLVDLEDPALADGFRLLTADEAGPEAVVQAHVDAWAPSGYTSESYAGIRTTPAYRGDLHLLVASPDGTMAASTIMWLDEANRTAEFEPVGTHPDYRRLGLGRAMLLHGLHRVRAAGATHATVACLGAPGHPRALGLYRSLGFREVSRDAPLIKA